MAESSRVQWSEIPAVVLAAVDELLGSHVVTAVSQSGGFSPGSADRVRCADGRRAFVKTATSDVNPEVVPIHRREAAIAAVLPSAIPVPRFIGAVDGGDWIALAFEEVEGRHPLLPWRADDLGATLDALAAAGAAPLGDAARDVILPAADRIADIADGWDRILTDPQHPVDTTLDDVAWAHAHAERWAQDAARVVADTEGDALLHFDTRDDNVLIRPDGTATLVDWPWAVRGAPWFDALMLLVSVRFHEPVADVGAIVAAHDAFTELDAAAADRAIAAFAGFMLDRGRHPAPPGLPTIREFQRAQGAVACRWLRERVG